MSDHLPISDNENAPDERELVERIVRQSEDGSILWRHCPRARIHGHFDAVWGDCQLTLFQPVSVRSSDVKRADYIYAATPYGNARLELTATQSKRIQNAAGLPGQAKALGYMARLLDRAEP